MTHATQAKPNRRAFKSTTARTSWSWFWDCAVFAAPLWDGSLTVFDTIQPVKLSPYNAPTLEQTQLGWGVRCDIHGDAIQATAPAQVRLNPPLSFCFGCVRRGSVGSNPTFFGVLTNNSASSPFTSFTIGRSATDGAFALYSNESGVFKTLAKGGSVNGIPSDRTSNLAAVMGRTEQQLYLDGSIIGTSAESMNTIQYDPTALVTFGDGVFASRNPVMTFIYGYIFDKALTTNQIHQINTDPFGMFRVYRLPAFATDLGPGILPYYSGGSMAAQRLTRGMGWVQ